MAVKLPDEKNPHSKVTPFDILGVALSASTREILEARDERLEDLDYQFEGEERIQERQKIMAAYGAVCDLRSRFSVVVFQFDNTVGTHEVTEAAKKHMTFKPDVGAVLEGDEDVFVTTPAVDHAAKQGRRLSLTHSIALEFHRHPYPVEPKLEALESITFDR